MLQPTEPSVVKSIRLPRTLFDRLTIQAGLEYRTVNNLISKMLTETLDAAPGSAPSNPAPEEMDKPA